MVAKSHTTPAASLPAALPPTPERLVTLDASGQAICTFAYPPSTIGAMEDFGGNTVQGYLSERPDPLVLEAWGASVNTLLNPTLATLHDTTSGLEGAIDVNGPTPFWAEIPWHGVDFFPGDSNEAAMPAFNGGDLILATPSLTPDVPRKHSENVSAVTCIVCGQNCLTHHGLRIHAGDYIHKTLKCPIDSCETRFSVVGNHERKAHMKHFHPDALQCNECDYVGGSLAGLAFHATDSGHTAFACKHDDCEKKFSRLDTYQRHFRSHADNAKRYPCKYCKKYRGPNGFKRKDHLAQHVRNYHHIGEDNVQYGGLSCAHVDCTDFRPWGSVRFPDQYPFKTSAERIKHMRTVHDESNFPCPQPGCDRVNGKGYFRKGDLHTHLRKVHGTTEDLTTLKN